MIRIESYQRDWIRRLANAGIGGNTENAVLWWLLQYAINEMTKDQFIQKYVEQRKMLMNAPSRISGGSGK